ncbi:MAG: Rrf2 family transcriptional regulator, partial [Acidobacteria bacterium]|nr:Rrf2 family transcriptional regulator [Acidobacteriota bacterium]
NLRFAVAIHTAGLLAWASKNSLTSEAIARSVSTNPVVVRRVVSLLAKHGIVTVRKGQGGGAALARPADQIGLDEIYRAVEPGTLTAIPKVSPDAMADCPVAAAVGPVLAGFFAHAEAGYMERLAHFTLADVVAAVEPRLVEHPGQTALKS